MLREPSRASASSFRSAGSRGRCHRSHGAHHVRRLRSHQRLKTQRPRRPKASTSRRSRDSSNGCPLNAQADMVSGQTIAIRSAGVMPAQGSGSEQPSFPTHSVLRRVDSTPLRRAGLSMRKAYAHRRRNRIQHEIEGHPLGKKAAIGPWKRHRGEWHEAKDDAENTDGSSDDSQLSKVPLCSPAGSDQRELGDHRIDPWAHATRTAPQLSREHW